MSFILPELPFAKDALGTFITPEGFDYHHGKHHAAYVSKLNAAVENDATYKELSLDDCIAKSHEDSNLGVFNNAAQHWNHSFFWSCLSPNGGGAATGKITEMIDKDFGSFDKFKAEFENKAATLFGSGWAWLVVSDGKLEIIQMSNAGTPSVLNKKAVLTIDVWEHAYYIDHRNARPSFISGYWNFVNWDFVNSCL